MAFRRFFPFISSIREEKKEQTEEQKLEEKLNSRLRELKIAHSGLRKITDSQEITD